MISFGFDVRFSSLLKTFVMQLFLFLLFSKLRKYLVFFSPSSYHFACDPNIAPLVI